MRDRTNRYYALGGAALLSLFLAIPLHAHHANAAYDRTHSVSISGTVTAWQFINPHAGIWIEVTDEQDTVAEWSGEFQGKLDLYRSFRWNKDTFAPGDEITLTGYPARDGADAMNVRIVVFADGRAVNVRSARE